MRKLAGLVFTLLLLVGGVAAAEMVQFDAYPATGVAPLEVRFTDHSTIQNIKYWHWEFGDGTSCYKQNPVHTYAEPGTYDVTLTVYTADNEHHHKKMAMVTVTGKSSAVTPAPQPTFKINTLHGGLSSTSSWSKKAGNAQNTNSIQNPGTLYATDGTIKWMWDSEVMSPYGLLLVDDNGNIWFRADEEDWESGNIHCIDADDGAMKYTASEQITEYGGMAILDGLVMGQTLQFDEHWYEYPQTKFVNCDNGVVVDTWDNVWLISANLAVDDDGYLYYPEYSDVYKFGNGEVAFDWYMWGLVGRDPPAIDYDGNIVIGGAGSAFIYSFDNETVGAQDDHMTVPTVFCIDSDTGETIWNQTVGGSPGGLAIGADGTIYGGCQCGIVFALNADGSIKWINTDADYLVGFTEDGGVSKVPALDSEGNVYLCADSWYSDEYWGEPWALGGEKPVSSQDVPYLGEHGLYKYTSAGVLEWVYPIDDEIQYCERSCVVGSDDTIYFCVQNYEEECADLYAVNSDGTLKWHYALESYQMTELALGDDGTLYVGTLVIDVEYDYHGRIYAFEAEPLSDTCGDNCFDGEWTSPDPHSRYPLWSNISTLQTEVIDTETAYFKGQLNWGGDPIPIWFEYGPASNSYGYCSPHVNVSGGVQLGNNSYYTYNFTYRQRDFPLYAGGRFYIRAACDYGYGEEMRFCLNSTDARPVPTYGDSTDIFIFSFRNGSTMASDLAAAVWSPYYLMMGAFFFGLVISAIFANMVMKQNSVIIPVMVALFCGSLIWSLFPPEFVQAAQAFYIMAVAGLVYWIFTKRYR